MKRNTYFKITLVLFLSIISIFAFAQKQISLKYNLNEGDIYKFETESAQEISFTANDQTIVMDMILGVFMTCNVNNVKDGLIDNSYVINRLKLNQKIFGMDINYDSDDSSTYSSGGGAQLAAQLGKIIGSSISMTMNEQGSIEKIDLSSLSENDDFSQEFKTGNYYAVYPDHKVKVGDSWEIDLNPIEGSDMKVHMKYTLTKTKKKEATINVTGTISANDINGAELNMDGETQGEMIINPQTGMLISSNMDVDLKMDIEQQGMKMPATILGTSKTKVSKVK